MLKAFETSVARLAPQLDESRRSGDRAGIRHVAHTLKSSSASIGALKAVPSCAPKSRPDPASESGKT
ncbi:MAG: Hpt domain-containing protein [Piscinibacter sp.]|nr:Hpt domain-containing protein [Piscinibacter sp.]